jgi:hypothetical protein
MKKILFTLTLPLLCIICNGQEYYNVFGISYTATTYPSPTLSALEVSYKCPTKLNFKGEYTSPLNVAGNYLCYDFILGWAQNEYVELSALKEKHLAISSPVSLYFGGGLYLGSYLKEHYTSRNLSVPGSLMTLGLGCDIGLQLVFSRSAITLAIRPEYELLNDDNGIHIRTQMGFEYYF